jgi:hypothetical protein
MTWWKCSYNPILHEMLTKLSVKYPDVVYCQNRVEFWHENGTKLVDKQDVRDAFPNYVEKDVRTMIAGWQIAEMQISPNPLKPLLERNVKIPSLQTLSKMQLSTYEIKMARELGIL